MSLMATVSAAKIALQVGSWVAKSGERLPDLPLPELEAVLRLNPSGERDLEDEITVTANQAANIDLFLRDPAIQTLLQISSLALLSENETRSYLEEVSNTRTFEKLAKKWCDDRSQTWLPMAAMVWRSIQEQQSAIFANLTNDPQFDSNAQVAVTDRFIFPNFLSKSQPAYLNSIKEIVADSARQEKMTQILAAAASTTEDADETKFAVQGVQDNTASFEDLFIERVLVDLSSGTQFAASAVLDTTYKKPRMVIVGDPGVGKSTLTSWMRWKSSLTPTGALRPIILTIVCRHALAATTSNLRDALQSQIMTRLPISISSNTVDDLLASGWIVLIVDGVDEILDQGHRRNIVAQLNSLATIYPLISIICTTRRTGFEVSLFKSTHFDVMALEEYSEEQTTTYVNRWFQRTDDRGKAGRFLGESRSLLDLRRNPLMLALLCTLYRQTDFIPRSRRDVYLRCASLMFHEWDPRRGISIPNLFKNQGEAILRDMAALIKRVGGVGVGIQEGQLTDLITTFLTTKGEEPLVARSAANELLEYCAGRAWILTKSTDRTSGVSSFKFTHRTFYEFFAAEATVRKVKKQDLSGRVPPAAFNVNLSPMTREVVQAHTEDDSSVMPELLIQAADDMMDGVGTSILKEVVQEASRSSQPRKAALISLAIRLVAAAGVHPSVADQVFAAMLLEWKTSSTTMRVDDFKNVLDVASGHRARLIESIKKSASAQNEFLERYARTTFLGEARMFSEDWEQLANFSFGESVHSAVKLTPIQAWYGHQVKLVSLDDAILFLDAQSLLLTEVENQFEPGLLWLTFGPSENMTKRRRTWSYATRALSSSQLLDADNEYRYTENNCIRAAPGLGGSQTRLPPTLALYISLLMGSENLGLLTKVVTDRKILDAAEQIFGIKSRIEQKWVSGFSNGEFAPVVSAHLAELNTVFSAVNRGQVPNWLIEYAGLKFDA